MNPFFFGPSERPLFGVYTHGKSGGGPEGAVLLCYPTGSEYMRAHRAFRQLNTLLNRVGLSVLRFDYSHTGDSAGHSEDASVATWLDDFDWAIEELKDNARVESVSVAGLRMGATLATRACVDRSDVEHLLLWDPIVSGGAYLDEVVGRPRPDGVVGVEGFPMTPSLREEIEHLDLTAAELTPKGMMSSILVAEDRPDYRQLADAWLGNGWEGSFRVVPSEGNWAQADPFGDALIPQQIIQSIVDELRVPTAR